MVAPVVYRTLLVCVKEAAVAHSQLLYVPPGLTQTHPLLTGTQGLPGTD